MRDMTKRKEITELFNSITRKRPGYREIKKFSSAFIELMCETGIPPRARREFYSYARGPSPDVDRLIEFAGDKMIYILEKI